MARERMKLAELNAQGEFSLVAPLDYLLLGFLPNEGEVFAGLYPMGETVPNLLKKFSLEQQKVLKTSLIVSRLRVLHLQKLVSKFDLNASIHAWQRTPAGVAELKRWESSQ